MIKLNILNQELFLEQLNKFVILDRFTYLNFVKAIISINNKDINKAKIDVNGLVLNDKNTMIIDFSSISSYCNTIYGNVKLKDEYIKTKLENYNDRDIKQCILNNEIVKILNSNYKGLYDTDFTIDIDKIIRQYTNIQINTEYDFFKILKYVIEKSSIKQYIIIYSKNIVDDFKIKKYIDNITYQNAIKIELCSEKSIISKSDNITFVKDMFYQISGSELYNLIKFHNKEINDEDIEKYFITSINNEGVDKMNENKIIKLKKICNERLNILNLKGFET